MEGSTAENSKTASSPSTAKARGSKKDAREPDAGAAQLRPTSAWRLWAKISTHPSPGRSSQKKRPLGCAGFACRWHWVARSDAGGITLPGADTGAPLQSPPQRGSLFTERHWLAPLFQGNHGRSSVGQRPNSSQPGASAPGRLIKTAASPVRASQSSFCALGISRG